MSISIFLSPSYKVCSTHCKGHHFSLSQQKNEKSGQSKLSDTVIVLIPVRIGSSSSNIEKIYAEILQNKPTPRFSVSNLSLKSHLSALKGNVNRFRSVSSFLQSKIIYRNLCSLKLEYSQAVYFMNL